MSSSRNFANHSASNFSELSAIVGFRHVPFHVREIPRMIHCFRSRSSLPRQTASLLFFFTACLFGCSGKSHEEIPFARSETGKAATDIVRGAPLDADQKRFYRGTLVTSDWVDSGDRKLSLRISTWIVSGEGPFTLIAELRNNTKEPIEVLRPFGDRYAAACHIEIRGPSGKCAYSGPKWSYTLGANAFATIAPGEVLSDRAEFPFENYKTCGEQGVYQIRYRYVRENPRGHAGQGPLWQGEITSAELRTHVGRDGSYRGDGEFERSVRFVATRPYRFSQAEAAKGVTLKYELIVDRDFLACVDAERGSNDGSNAFPVFEVIHGGDHLYGRVNLAIPPATPPHYAGEAAKVYSRGRYRYEMKWDGRNWRGSDGCSPEAPNGPPFPPGEYQLTLTASGIVEESDGARWFQLKAVAPVVITP